MCDHEISVLRGLSGHPWTIPVFWSSFWTCLLLFVWFEWSVSPVKMAVFSRVQLCNRGEFTTNHHHFDTNPKQQQRRKWPTCVDSTCERTETGGDNVIVLNAFYIDVFWFEGLMLRVVFHTVTEIVQIKCRPSVSLCFSSWMRFTQQFKVSFALIISKGYLIWLKKSKDNNVHRRHIWRVKRYIKRLTS